MTLLAILFALLIDYALHLPPALRSAQWLAALARGIGQMSGDSRRAALLTWVGLVFLPLAVVTAGGILLTAYGGVLAALIYAAVVLVYSFGPLNIDREVNRVLAVETEAELPAAAAGLVAEPLPASPEARSRTLVEAVFSGALRCWFGVIFWFMVFGPAGALLFRMARWMMEESVVLSARQRHWSAALAAVLEWPVSQLMTLGLALVTDFDTVFKAWRHYHREQGHGLWEGDNGFLLAAAWGASRDAAAARDGFTEERRGPLAPVALARDLAWRLLGIWLAVIALLLIVSWIA